MLPGSGHSSTPASRLRAGTTLRVAAALVVASLVAACDKCGDSIFRMDAGPIACKNEVPR
jgi:hypothetical protein